MDATHAAKLVAEKSVKRLEEQRSKEEAIAKAMAEYATLENCLHLYIDTINRNLPTQHSGKPDIIRIESLDDGSVTVSLWESSKTCLFRNSLVTVSSSGKNETFFPTLKELHKTRIAGGFQQNTTFVWESESSKKRCTSEELAISIVDSVIADCR